MASTIVYFRGKRACTCLQKAIPIVEKNLIALGAIKKDLSGLVTQGSYNTSVRASGGTHALGGVWDMKWDLVNTNEKKKAWWDAGIIPFDRRTSDAPVSKWPNHGHVVVVGCPHLHASALVQVLAAQMGRNALASNGKFRGWMPERIMTWSEAYNLHRAANKNPIPRVYHKRPFSWIYEDGILGAQTLDRLRQEMQIAVTGSPKWGHWDIRALRPWLGRPDTGSGVLTPTDVIYLQSRVGVKKDGVLGPVTIKALQQWLNLYRS